MKSKLKRTIALLLCLVMAMTALPVKKALAAGQITVVSEGNDAFDYFEKYIDGEWSDLHTPKHTILETGEVAYCIQHKLPNPHGDEYSEFDPYINYSTRTIRGVQIILENGYPCSTNGFTDDEARQATANALRFWLSEEGADSQYNFTNRLLRPGYVRAKTGYEALLVWADELVQLAREQQFLEHSVTFSPSSLELVCDGDYFVGTTSVILVNCSGGYRLDESALPSGSVIEGYTGEDGDTLTIKIPKQYGNQSIRLDAVGYDHRTTANLFWYAPDVEGSQKLVTYSTDSLAPVKYSALYLSTPAYGNVRIVKSGEDGELLSGVVFGMYGDPDCTDLLAELTTDENGCAVSGDMAMGRYYLKELSTVPPYVVSDTVYPVDVQAAETVEIDLTNAEAKGIIRITKINANPEMGEHSLEGCVFDILNDGGVVASVTVDAEGEGMSPALDLGSYIVKERQASTGFVLNGQEYPVTLTYGGQTAAVVYGDVTIANEPQTGTITVVKADAETGGEPQGDTSLYGAEWEIRDRSGKVVDTLHALGNRSVTSKELPLGTYTVHEITAPMGYQLIGSPVTVTLSYGGQDAAVVSETAAVKNEVIKGRIELLKFGESDTGIMPPLANVKFEVRLKSSNELYDTITTDENGSGTSKLLPYGLYVVTELRSDANEDYELLPPFEVFINEHGKTYSYILENERIEMMVRIVKLDAESGHIVPVAGTTFRIENSVGAPVTFDVLYPYPHTMSEFQTDGSGTLYLPGTLPVGSYKLYEVLAPEPYLLNDEPVAFTVSDDNAENDTVTVSMEDEPVKGIITIEKKGEILTGYTIEETEYGTLYIPVYELMGLEGVVYELFAAENIGVPGKVYHTAGELICELVTDENGIAASEKLYLGKYIVKEKATVSGFVLDDEEHEVTLSYSDQHTAVVSERLSKENQRQRAVVELRKTAEYFDETTGAIYTGYGEGFVFGLYTAEEIAGIPANALIDILVTDDEGKAQSSADLPLTEFYLKELKAPHDGYALSSERYAVDLTSGNDTDEMILDETHSTEPIHNELITRKIQIMKLDAESGRRLAGAVFEIIDAETQTVIGLIQVGRNGIGTSGELPVLRRFILREKTAPAGFCLSTEEISFTLTPFSDETVVFTFENEPTEVEIIKTDAMTQSRVSGAAVTVYDELTGKIVFEGETDSQGSLIVRELKAGRKYRFIESRSPEGFAINNSEFFFEIDEYGNVTGETEITDEPISVMLEKKNAYDGMPMPGVVFGLENELGERVKLKLMDEGFFVPAEDGEETFAVDTQGRAEIRYLPVGEYSLLEQTPAGFVAAERYILSITDENGIQNPYHATITNSPTSIKIYKVHAATNEPLTGAGFTFKVKDGEELKALSFTKNFNGAYVLDENGVETTLMVDELGELVLIGVPLGDVWIEESVVPEGFFPSPAYRVTITGEDTFEIPYQVTVQNTPSVPLGIDRDKYNVPIAIAICLMGIGVVTWRIAAAKKKVRRQNDGA